jgi:UDP-GlcNAc:undecaprenyl-phosphate/decaprenyl-phosphate GlcNAc-1-phosphate transferase
MQYLAPGLSAFLLTLLVVWIGVKGFPRLGLMDRPQKYGLKRAPIPYPGGILLVLVFIALCLVFFEPTAKLVGLLLGVALLGVVSFIDDRLGLSPWVRLLNQIVVAVIVSASGIGIYSISNPFGGILKLDTIQVALDVGPVHHTLLLFSSLFTIVWIVLIVNTMNWLDGVPGLVSGISAIGSFTLFFLSISPLVNQPEVATLALIVGAMALAFWLFDFYPPKILIGDSGTMFFGLLLAVMAIFSGGKIATAFLILGFAILDALYVIVYRLYRRQAPWKGGEWDKYRKAVHLHHRLLASGFSERQVLLMIYGISAIFGITALFIGTKGKFWAIVVLASVSFIVGLILKARQKGAK